MSQFHVVSTKTCKFCKEAVNLLDAEDLAYQVTYLEDDPCLKTLMSMANLTTVPQIFRPDGKLVGGFNNLKAYIGRI
tara:strand:- start:195 stop:425 length:231 start_codon:yes stop_codon:yes gene_type:complete